MNRTSRLIPSNSEYRRHLNDYDNHNLFLARSKKNCPNSGAKINPEMYPCFEQGCPFAAPEIWKDCPEPEVLALTKETSK